MEDLEAFQQFYDADLKPQLLRFEKRRKRLLLSMGLGVLVLILGSIGIFSFGLFSLSVFLVIPWFLLFRFFRYRAAVFRAGYKPIVMKALLDYMDDNLTYYAREYISKDTFERSHIFPNTIRQYKGEDYIMGKIGEIFFEMCELEIFHINPIQGRLERWFGGIFFHANFNTAFKGRVVMLPRSRRQDFLATIKYYTRYGGYELTETGDEVFDDAFLVYLDRDVPYKDILTPELIAAIKQYRFSSGKQVYASFYNSHFYVAIDEPQNLLQASVWHSNLSFERIVAYYTELLLFTQIVRDFDIMHWCLRKIFLTWSLYCSYLMLGDGAQWTASSYSFYDINVN